MSLTEMRQATVSILRSTGLIQGYSTAELSYFPPLPSSRGIAATLPRSCSISSCNARCNSSASFNDKTSSSQLASRSERSRTRAAKGILKRGSVPLGCRTTEYSGTCILRYRASLSRLRPVNPLTKPSQYSSGSSRHVELLSASVITQAEARAPSPRHYACEETRRESFR